MVRYLKVRHILSPKDNLLTSGQIYNFVTEIFILLMQPYPFCQGDNSAILITKAKIFRDTHKSL